MTDNSADINRRNQILIINLAMIMILILCLVISIAVYLYFFTPNPQALGFFPQEPFATQRPTLPPSPTPQPSLTPTITNTLLATPTPTASLTPTWTSTPSITPAPTGPPALIPFRPNVDASVYSLKTWTPEEANRMVSLMEFYPNTLSEQARGKDMAAYYAAYRFAITAQEESLLRFPDSPLADGWRWGLAYNLARTGDLRAGSHFSELIARGLNRGETDINNLYIWFQQQEPRLTLHQVAFEPPSGYIASYIIEIRGSGSAFIRLVQTSSAYQAVPLWTHFDFVNQPEAKWIIADLNNDPEDGDEIAIYFSTPPGSFNLDAPRVFNLSQPATKELIFSPDENIFPVGMEFDNYWRIQENNSGGDDLVFSPTVFPVCPLTLSHVYHWNGTRFELVAQEYKLDTPALNMSYCEFIVSHAENNWGPQAALDIMEQLTPDWPPATDPEGNPSAADAIDGWRYRLGVNYALTGEVDTAKYYLNLAANSPSTSLSRWIQPAMAFLKTYQRAEDIYRACLGASFCYPSYALEYLVDHLPSGNDAFEYLKASGVNTFASGYFDFDDDGVTERWFTARHRPLESLEFWILAGYKPGIRALYLADVESNIPELVYLEEAFISEEALHLQPVIFLDRKIAFSMQRTPDSKEPFLVAVPLRRVYPNRFLAELDSAAQDLFSGRSPLLVRDHLLNIAEWPGLLCTADWSCDPYYYLLGLASELAGDEKGSVAAYHRLWSDYSKSPYTTMARLKLVGGEFVPTATPTATSSATATLMDTPTGQPTATLAGTATPTITGTLPTATPSPSFTPTTSGTPATATVTPTTTSSTPYP